MEQMKMDGLDVVQVDYDNVKYSDEIRTYRPAVYKDGDSFCCLLGPDPQEGIFGCGDSPDDALEDWRNEFHHRLAEAGEDDPIGQEIRDYRSTSKGDVW